MLFRVCFILCLTLSVANARVNFLTNDLINEINSAQTTWKAGPNKFMSWSEESVRRLMSVKSDNAQQHKLLQPIEREIPEDLPDNYDLRTEWPKCSPLKQISDQKSCGASWAFSSVEVMADRICIASNGTKQFNISIEDVITCCSECGFGCDGGYPEAVWKYYQQFGIVTGNNDGSRGGCKPYECSISSINGNLPPAQDEAPEPGCIKKCIDGYPIAYDQDKHYAASTYSVPSHEKQIRTELYKNGSVVAIFTVYNDFLAYKSGVYQHKTGQALGGPAVKILGWGVDNSTPYWLAANSWGEEWGDKGFFKILRGHDECGIESGVIAGMPKLD